MGVYDREYSKSEWRVEPGIAWGSYLPPRGAMMLIGLHILAFVVVSIAAHGNGATMADMLVLQGASSHPAAIVLHPVGLRSVWTLIFVSYAIWTLGGRVESRFGTGRLLLAYALATLIAGAVYFGFAQVASDLTGYPLALPAGALAAWALGAWRNLSDEMVSVFGRLVTVAKATGIGAAIVAGVIFFWHGPAATGWLIAAAAGSLAWPVVNLGRSTATARDRLEPQVGRTSEWRRPFADRRSSTGDDPVVDEILERISREGLESLTAAERERLEAARQAKLRRPR